MKTKLLSLFVALLATTALWAYDCKIDGIYFNLNNSNLTAEVTYESEFYSGVTYGMVHRNSYSGSIIIPSKITYANVDYSVNKIGDYAFVHCSLDSITISASITSIGDYAFGDGLEGSKLIYISVDVNNTTFDSRNDCNAIIETSTNTLVVGCKNTIIPSSVTSIGEYAFYNCSGLASVTIPNSVNTIEDSAFRGCKGLTSVTIPNSVTTIGTQAFYNVLNIVYHGIATGSPWGAKFVNCYVDGNLLYSDSTKTTLKRCISQTITEVVIPNSVKTIGDNAFYDCSGLTSVTIPNSVTTIGEDAFYNCSGLTSVTMENYFTAYQYHSFPSSTNVICVNPITTSLVDKKICSVVAKITIPEIYYEWYDEIGLLEMMTTNHMAIDMSGIITFTNGPFKDKNYHFYAKKGTEYVYKPVSTDPIIISTQIPSLSCSFSATQTTITLSDISASTDESVNALTRGIYYNGKRYEADKNNKVVITGIVPNTKCTLLVYGCYNSNYYYGNSMYVTTQAIAPILTVTESPTCVYAKGSYTHGDATVLGTSVACTTTGSSVAGDEGLMTGLKPNTSYSFTYSVDTKEGGTYTATKTVTTPALTLTTLTPKVVSAGIAVVAAETNISDYETNVGFEWRKETAPDGSASKSGAAIICNGVMEGRLLNLGTDWWKVRPYYEAADGTRYYGEWEYIDPTDASYFEPTVHTYALATSPTANKVQVRGYVMTGTDEVTEQGFEYWIKNAKVPSRMQTNAANANSDIIRVQASGQVMTAVLENLAYSTTYTCRAYAIAGGKTYYGEEVQFLTPEEIINDGLEDVWVAPVQSVTKFIRNNQLHIFRNGKMYNAMGGVMR